MAGIDLGLYVYRLHGVEAPHWPDSIVGKEAGLSVRAWREKFVHEFSAFPPGRRIASHLLRGLYFKSGCSPDHRLRIFRISRLSIVQRILSDHAVADVKDALAARAL